MSLEGRMQAIWDFAVVGGGASGMAAAIAAIRCKEPVTILGAEAVSKSYPGFFADYRALGGIVTFA